MSRPISARELQDELTRVMLVPGSGGTTAFVLWYAADVRPAVDRLLSSAPESAGADAAATVGPAFTITPKVAPFRPGDWRIERAAIGAEGGNGP